MKFHPAFGFRMKNVMVTMYYNTVSHCAQPSYTASLDQICICYPYHIEEIWHSLIDECPSELPVHHAIVPCTLSFDLNFCTHPACSPRSSSIRHIGIRGCCMRSFRSMCFHPVSLWPAAKDASLRLAWSTAESCATVPFRWLFQVFSQIKHHGL